MPALLEPGVEFWVWLDSDDHHEAESRPMFEVRAMSARELARYEDQYRGIWDELQANRDEWTEEKLVERLAEHFATALVGWKNMGRDYDPDSLPDLLLGSELIELNRKVSANNYVTPATKKNSASPE